VQRERGRKDYTGLEYIMSKAFTETPLDVVFSLVFTSVLKLCTGVRIEWKQLSMVFSLVTVAGASLGFLLGSLSQSEEAAIAAAMPIVVILMVVGIINPSGVDVTAPTPPLVTFFKRISPIAWSIEALVVAEFSGMTFAPTRSFFGFQNLRNLPRMGALALVQNGDDVLQALGVNVKFDAALSHMATLSLVNFVSSWVCLSLWNTGLEHWKSRLQSFFKARQRHHRREDAGKSESAVVANSGSTRGKFWVLPSRFKDLR